MSLLQQLIQLLTEPPDSLVYHIIILLALQATFGLSLWQLRRDPTDDFARRLVWASGGIFLARLIVVLARLLIDDQLTALTILPPLERAVDTATAALLVWALIPQPAGLPRISDGILVIFLLLVGFMYAAFVNQWQDVLTTGTISGGYAATLQAAWWDITQLILLSFGAIMIGIGRPSFWLGRLTVLAVLWVVHLVNLVIAPDPVSTEVYFPYWIRLGNLITFPLLAIIAYRHNLSRLIPLQKPGPPLPKLQRLLFQARSVIDLNLDERTNLEESLKLAADIIGVPFTAFGLTMERNPKILQIFCRQFLITAGTSGDLLGPLEMALNDWPAVRIALREKQQVELLPNGSGARQLYDFYQKMNVTGLGALLIEPLVIGEQVLGVMMLAGPADRESWLADDRASSVAVGAFLAQAILNTHQIKRLKIETIHGASDPSMVESVRYFEVLKERDEALERTASLFEDLEDAEARLKAEIQRVETLDDRDRFSDEDSEKAKALEDEISALHVIIGQAERALALAAAGDAGLDPEWVLRTVSGYSGELENAHARIKYLEARLAQQQRADLYTLLGSETRSLRTPLTTLAGYTEMLLDEQIGLLDSRQSSLLRRMQVNIRQMTSVLDLIEKNIRRGRPVLIAERRVDVRQVIEESVSTVTGQLQAKSLKLDLDIADHLPSMRSAGEGFQQIITHLLGNACQVSEVDGYICIRIRINSIIEKDLAGDEEPLKFLQLSISDNGGSRSQELYTLIVQAQRQRGSGEKQANLTLSSHGLSKALNLIAAHAGRSWIEPLGNRGSTITAVLPLTENNLNGSS